MVKLATVRRAGTSSAHMIRLTNTLALFVCCSLDLPAQMFGPGYFPRHNFTVGAGVGRPREDLQQFLNDSPGLSVGYGYRFHRNFQADIGLDVQFGAADVRDFVTTGIGDFRIRDREFLVPFGGRAILPFDRGRFMFSAGGGGAYLRYSELLRQPSSDFRIDCRVCTSRSGWGYYALVNASAFVDRGQHFRVGVTSRFYRGHTDGDRLGPLPGFRTKDQWINLIGEFGFSF